MDKEIVIIKGEKVEVEDNKLDLRERKIKSISEIKNLEKLTNLQELRLQYNNIKEIEGLETLTNLKHLDFYQNQIKEIRGLENLTNLQKLYLGNNQIEEINGLETLTKLQSLRIQNNKIREIKGLRTLINLQKLWLYNNRIEVIKGLENITKLEILNLRKNQLEEIKGIEILVNLKELDLSFNKLTKISGLENLKNLKKIELSNNPIIRKEYYIIGQNAQDIVEYCKNKGKVSYEFDFALSFAGEDRDLVENIANSLRDKGLNIFYDEFFKSDLIGKDLSNYFKKIYGSKSRFVVIFISKHYPVKDWTNFEFEIAKEEAKKRKQEFILPIKLDDTLIHGLKRTIGYIDFLKKGLLRTVDILIEKANKYRDDNRSKKLEKLENQQKNKLNSYIKELRNVPKGYNGANQYHKLISNILLEVCKTSFSNMEMNRKSFEGKIIIDTIYTNSAQKGFFKNLPEKNQTIISNYIILKTVNYSSELTNEVFDQFASRLNRNIGNIGLLTCRELNNISLALKRCRRYALDEKKYIIILSDFDIIKLIELSRDELEDEISTFFDNKFKSLII